MRKLILVAGLAAATLIPSVVLARPSCEEQRDNRVVGTVAGAGMGALIGGAIAGEDNRAAGAVGGAVGGALIGNQLAKPNSDCADADGYYDRDGAWVATSSGYYETNGRWVAGQAAGAYDADGHWTPGARSGHSGPDGAWVADAQPGYYDTDHRWRAGRAWGYYDARGVWIATAPVASAADARGADISYESGRGHADRPRDLETREGWLEKSIRAAGDDGSLSHYEARRDLSELNSIRRQQDEMGYASGRLAPRDEAQLQRRLDHLSADLAATGRDPRHGY